MDVPTPDSGSESVTDELETDETQVSGAADESIGEEESSPPFPPIYRRFIDVFFSPGKMGADVAREPRWAVALLVGALLIGLQFGIIPAEIYEIAQRRQILSAGGDPSQVPEAIARFLPLISAVFGTLAVCIMTFLMSGIYAIIFAFVLGDEGRYRQYLAISAHALFIPALIGLFLTPLRISTENPQASLNLGSFFFFLPVGYWRGVFMAMDITQIWSALVMAQGVHAIDSRRSVKSAATILLGFIVVLALIFGRFIPQ
jgi:hypothetical protein